MYRYKIKLYIVLTLAVSISSLLILFFREFEISKKKIDIQRLNRNNIVKVSKSNRKRVKLSPIVRAGKTKNLGININKVQQRIKLTNAASSMNSIFPDSNIGRLNRLEQVCTNNPGIFKAKSNRRPYNHNTFVSFNRSLIFCQIQKSGSTFWKTIIFNRSTTVPESLFNLKSKDEKYRNFFKFLFVRDPYQRLFSGYVDKLFNPNPVYWEIVGRVVKALTRDTKETGCGHDITFSEFIKYIVLIEKLPNKRDRHFFSMYEHCEPCDHKKIDYIGKVETFNRDAEAIIKAIKMNKSTISTYNSLRANSTLLDIESMADRLFGYKKRVLKCMTMYEAVLRIWRNLQIQGIIGRNIIFPFTPLTVKNLTKDRFFKKLRQAHIFSRTDTTRHNKEDAFLEAYASVPYIDLMKLKDIVEKDCLLFGYDSKPARVFNAKLFKKSNFQFFRV